MSSIEKSIAPVKTLQEAFEQSRHEVTELNIQLQERDVAIQTLWDLLDDIDTFADMIHPKGSSQSDALYQKVVDKKANRRHRVRESDGYKLFMPGTLPIEGVYMNSVLIDNVPDQDCEPPK